MWLKRFDNILAKTRGTTMVMIIIFVQDVYLV